VGALNGVDVGKVAEGLRQMGLDGWLLYDFRGINPVARRVIGTTGLGTRRLFVYIPADGGTPTAVAHRIELQGVSGFPGDIRPYAGWQELHRELGRLVANRKVAMEISEHDAVPYLDWVPHGVVGLVQHLGGSVMSSADLVSQFAARLTESEMQEHRKAAEIIAKIARETVAAVVKEAGTAREAAVQRRVLEAFDQNGLSTTHPPIVAFGANAANPHYEPKEGSDALLQPNQVVLLDLWAGTSEHSVFGDQTWMGFAGGAPPAEVEAVWTAVREARDAVVAKLRLAASTGHTLRGSDLDDVARGVISARGFGDAFVHRTGHSIDFDLHGSGPHLDNFETHDTRSLLPGIAFSVEPGVYLEGRFGVRTEINVLMAADGPEPTPMTPQEELILPS
jgi:Xaa-Pro aminopeptidase